MKTPKRNTGNPRAVDLYAQRHSRWKRKNRIKKLKHTIGRLYKDNTQLRLLYLRYEHLLNARYGLNLDYERWKNTINIKLTPGELVATIHALKQQTRFNTTEQRQDNESAINKLTNAFSRQKS